MTSSSPTVQTPSASCMGCECVNPRVTCRYSDNLTVVEQALGVER